LERNHAPLGHAEDVGPLHVERVHEAKRVLRKQIDGIGLVRFVAVADAAIVEGDRVEMRGESRDMLLEDPTTVADARDHDKRGALAAPIVGDPDAIGFNGAQLRAMLS